MLTPLKNAVQIHIDNLTSDIKHHLMNLKLNYFFLFAGLIPLFKIKYRNMEGWYIWMELGKSTIY